MSRSPPSAVTWFKVYVGGMTLLCVVAFIAGITMLTADFGPDVFDPDSPFGGDGPSEQTVLGWVYLLGSLPFMGLFAAGLFTKPTKAWWIFAIVLICLGLTNLCCLPVCIPLLVVWLKPDVKEWFNAGSRPPADVF